MHDLRVANRYAKALFETALKYDVVSPVEDDLNGIVALLKNDEQFRFLLLSPHVSRDEKLKIVDKLFSDRVTAITMHAIRLILAKRREGEIEWMQSAYIAFRRQHENVLHTVITTSESLANDQRDKVLERLRKATGKEVEPEFRIEPHLIGGIRVAYENYVLDGSLRGELRRLRERLLHDVLKQS